MGQGKLQRMATRSESRKKPDNTTSGFRQVLTTILGNAAPNVPNGNAAPKALKKSKVKKKRNRVSFSGVTQQLFDSESPAKRRLCCTPDGACTPSVGSCTPSVETLDDEQLVLELEAHSIEPKTERHQMISQIHELQRQNLLELLDRWVPYHLLNVH